jgi:hypothetical protein
MIHCFVWLFSAIFLSILPGTGLAQQDAGIPPMLESPRPLTVPTTQPQPKPPPQSQATSVPVKKKGNQTKKVQKKKAGGRKAAVAGHKTNKKAVPKKGVTSKPRGKVPAHNS